MEDERVFSIRVGVDDRRTITALVSTAHGDERTYRTTNVEELVDELVGDLHDAFDNY